MDWLPSRYENGLFLWLKGKRPWRRCTLIAGGRAWIRSGVAPWFWGELGMEKTA